jgi:AraC family transcriptional regulator
MMIIILIEFDPSTYFTNWSATEVSAIEDMPENSRTLLIPQGLYAVFCTE